MQEHRPNHHPSTDSCGSQLPAPISCGLPIAGPSVAIYLAGEASAKQNKTQKIRKKNQQTFLLLEKELLPTLPASRNETGSSFHICPKLVSQRALSHRPVCRGLFWVRVVTRRTSARVEISRLHLQSDAT